MGMEMATRHGTLDPNGRQSGRRRSGRVEVGRAKSVVTVELREGVTENPPVPNRGTLFVRYHSLTTRWST